MFDTDDAEFGGHNRLLAGHKLLFKTTKDYWNNRPYYIHVYIPSRTGIVMISRENAKKYNIEIPQEVEEPIVNSEIDSPAEGNYN